MCGGSLKRKKRRVQPGSLGCGVVLSVTGLLSGLSLSTRWSDKLNTMRKWGFPSEMAERIIKKVLGQNSHVWDTHFFIIIWPSFQYAN